MQNFAQNPNLKSEVGAAILIFGVFARIVAYAYCEGVAQGFPLQLKVHRNSLHFNILKRHPQMRATG